MTILLDAQLPRSIIRPLEGLGCDARHTLDLPEGNRSSDHEISSIADRDQRIVFGKDADFVRSHLLRGTPARLLIALLLHVLPELIRLFDSRHRTSVLSQALSG